MSFTACPATRKFISIIEKVRVNLTWQYSDRAQMEEAASLIHGTYARVNFMNEAWKGIACLARLVLVVLVVVCLILTLKRKRQHNKEK